MSSFSSRTAVYVEHDLYLRHWGFSEEGTQVLLISISGSLKNEIFCADVEIVIYLSGESTGRSIPELLKTHSFTNEVCSVNSIARGIHGS